jgi:hypothetical protein
MIVPMELVLKSALVGRTDAVYLSPVLFQRSCTHGKLSCGLNGVNWFSKLDRWATYEVPVISQRPCDKNTSLSTSSSSGDMAA